MGMVAPSRSNYPTEPTVDEDVRMPSSRRLDSFVDALFADKQSRPYQYIVKERRLSGKILKHFRIGWDPGNDAYTIPLLDEDGDLVNVKWWHPEWSPQAKKKGHKDFFYVGGGRPWLLLFPRSHTLRTATEPIRTLEGEVEATTALDR